MNDELNIRVHLCASVVSTLFAFFVVKNIYEDALVSEATHKKLLSVRQESNQEVMHDSIPSVLFRAFRGFKMRILYV